MTEIDETDYRRGSPNLERRILGIASLAVSTSHMENFLYIHVFFGLSEASKFTSDLELLGWFGLLLKAKFNDKVVYF